MWKKYIDEDLIEMFMDRLFKECRYSAFDMDNILKDFALSGKEILNHDEEEELESKLSEIKQLEKFLKDEEQKKLKAIRLTEIIRIEKDEFESLTKDLIDENKKLRKQLENSVLFSMGD